MNITLVTSKLFIKDDGVRRAVWNDRVMGVTSMDRPPQVYILLDEVYSVSRESRTFMRWFIDVLDHEFVHTLEVEDSDPFAPTESEAEWETLAAVFGRASDWTRDPEGSNTDGAVYVWRSK